jgi:hypothetical protein
VSVDEFALLGLALHRLGFGPGRANVSYREGLTEISTRIAALMSNAVALHKPGHFIVPVRPGLERDLRLQQRPGLVPERPRSWSCLCSPANRRSIVAGSSRKPRGVLSTEVKLITGPKSGHDLTPKSGVIRLPPRRPTPPTPCAMRPAPDVTPCGRDHGATGWSHTTHRRSQPWLLRSQPIPQPHKHTAART